MRSSVENIAGQRNPRKERLCPVCGREIAGRGWRTCGDKRCKTVWTFTHPTDLSRKIDQHWDSGVRGDSEIARIVGCTPQHVRYRRVKRTDAQKALDSLAAELGSVPQE